MKAIALLRKSTTEEGRRSLSHDRQLDIIRQRAAQDGASISQVLKYSDPGGEVAHLEGAVAIGRCATGVWRSTRHHSARQGERRLRRVGREP